MTTELEEKFQELSSEKSVRGVLILNAEGAAVKSSVDTKTTEAFSSMIHEIVALSRKLFQEVDPNNDLTFMRFRTKKHEIMVVPDKEYMLIVVHHPQE